MNDPSMQLFAADLPPAQKTLQMKRIMPGCHRIKRLLLAKEHATVSGGCREIYVLLLAVPHFLVAHGKLQGFKSKREDTELPA